MFQRFAALLIVLAAASHSAAADVPYLDDRSDAASLVRSLYNAVNRREYARAFGYFAAPPAKSFAAYAKGYEGTTRVDVVTGPVAEEGAAGSIFFTVPVAIKSYAMDGGEKVFAGCYVVRQVNAGVQEPPFRALQIESGKLKPTDSYSVEGAVPDCGIESAGVEPATVQDAISLYLRTFGATCPQASAIASGGAVPELHDIAPAEEGGSGARLFRFPCAMAAYNESSVYLLDNGIEGLRPVSLPQPVMDIAYEGTENSTLKSMSIKGFSGDIEVLNSDFSDNDKSLSTFAKWRGIGDASSNATYAFADGRFVLQRFDVDPTYDEKINPYVVIENGRVLPVPQLSETAD